MKIASAGNKKEADKQPLEFILSARITAYLPHLPFKPSIGYRD